MSVADVSRNRLPCFGRVLVLALSEYKFREVRKQMNVCDIAIFDGHVQVLDKWMGSILCPDPGCMQNKVNLLEKGIKVPF
jgi:hypothetical protein